MPRKPKLTKFLVRYADVMTDFEGLAEDYVIAEKADDIVMTYSDLGHNRIEVLTLAEIEAQVKNYRKIFKSNKRFEQLL